MQQDTVKPVNKIMTGGSQSLFIITSIHNVILKFENELIDQECIGPYGNSIN